MSKHIDGQKLQQSNQILEEASTHLLKERDSLQLRHDKQLSRLRFFEQALESCRGRLTKVLDDWNHPSRLNLAGLPDMQTLIVLSYFYMNEMGLASVGGTQS